VSASTAPSAHAVSLAGLDLVAAEPPVVRTEIARELVVVVSRGRDAAREIFLDRCRKDAVPVLVRPTGGGAVVLGPGVVVGSALQVATGGCQFAEPYFGVFCGAVVEVLAECGVAGAARRGTSDVCVGDRKVAGCSLRLWRGRVLFQVSLLVDLDLGLLGRYLRAPTREPAYRRQRPHREFVTTMRSAGSHASCEEVATALQAALTAMRLRAGAASV